MKELFRKRGRGWWKNAAFWKRKGKGEGTENREMRSVNPKKE